MIKSWSFPVFSGYKITVVSSNDIKKAIGKFKHTKNVDVENTEACHIAVENEPLSYIFVPHRITLSQMVHESYHAIRRLMRYHGVNLDDNEVVAYHLGYLVQQISDWRWSWK